MVTWPVARHVAPRSTLSARMIDELVANQGAGPPWSTGTGRATPGGVSGSAT